MGDWRIESDPSFKNTLVMETIALSFPRKVVTPHRKSLTPTNVQYCSLTDRCFVTGMLIVVSSIYVQHLRSNRQNITASNVFDAAED